MTSFWPLKKFRSMHGKWKYYAHNLGLKIGFDLDFFSDNDKKHVVIQTSVYLSEKAKDYVSIKSVQYLTQWNREMYAFSSAFQEIVINGS